MSGIKGYRYGFPNGFKEVSFTVKRIPAKKIPTIPRVVAKSIKNIRQNLMAFTIPISENISDAIAESEIIITIIGDTIPADTAASPKTIAPRIEIALPERCGILMSLSLSISKTKIKPKASIMAGKGTPSRCAAKFINKVTGIVS